MVNPRLTTPPARVTARTSRRNPPSHEKQSCSATCTRPRSSCSKDVIRQCLLPPNQCEASLNLSRIGQLLGPLGYQARRGRNRPTGCDGANRT
eukprot:4902066-Pyramimonas_sp.AAC.1